MKIQRILVPLDFSEPSLEALRYATDLAKRFRAKIALVHVIEPLVPIASPHLYAEPIEFGAVFAAQERTAKTQLAFVAGKLAKRRIRAETRLLSGAPYDRICIAAKKLRADLIVMATKGRTGLSHVFLGSVAEMVVRTAPCPVLTLRSKKRPARSRKPGAASRAKRGARA